MGRGKLTTSARPRLIGLTGGIATGKSLVAAMFGELGARIIDADRIAREVVEPGKPAYLEIIEEFGDRVVGTEGLLDRNRIKTLVFSDPKKRSRLEEITHPRIAVEIARLIQDYSKTGDEPIIIEAALLIETTADIPFDHLVVVTCTEEEQIRRIRARDGISEEDARNIILAQLPTSEKLKYADTVIENHGSPERTRELVRRAWELITSEKD